MFAYRTDQGSHPRTAVLKAGTRLRRLATAMAAVTVALLASVVTIPAAFARVIPPPGGSYGTASVAPVPSATVHAAAADLAGSQITLIAVGAALAAAAVTILLDRVRTARSAVPSPVA
jgi:hypothetical protein